MKNKKRTTYILVIFLFFAGIATGYFLFHEKESLDDKNAIDYEKEISSPSDTSSDRISIPGYGTLQMQENSDVLKVVLLNPKNNPCYFKFTLILDETGDILYESKMVAPGKAIVEEKLNQAIGKGTHPITIRIQTYALDDNEQEMNGSEVKTEIVTFTVDE